MGNTNKNKIDQLVTADTFRAQFRNLIFLTWTGPPIVGLSFLFYIRMFNGDQMIAIIKAPLENLFVVGSLIFCVWYFNRFMQPVVRLLDSDDSTLVELAVKRIRRFPLHYWSLFLIYLVIAPSTVILTAEWYTDFVASPIDWFRIHLVALIVSIIVGLPIFFLILDLFGKVMGPIGLDKPHVTIKAKVFMIGALVPLLIDTMLVQYYWTRTGYFSFETFVVWLGLELLAIGGSIIFVRSFGQSLRPLQNLSEHKLNLNEQKFDLLRPQSTDELGVLATNYRNLINNWHINNKILQMNTRILRTSGSASSLAEVVDDIIRVCEEMIGDDMVFLILQSESGDELIGVAQTDGSYNSEGYFRIPLDETSLAMWIFSHGEPAIINDVEKDHRVSERMRKQFNTKSAIGVPLKVGEEVIGVLMTIGQKIREYSMHERMLLEGIAREAAIAVNTYQLYQQRMSAELARQDNEELLHLIMSATEEGIYGVDINGKCIFINPAGLKLLGYDHEDELLGQSIHELIHHTFPDGSPYPKQLCQVKQATQQGLSAHSDQEMNWRKDGTGFPVEYWSHPIYKEGKVAGTVVTFIDITERMKTMKKMRYQAQVIEQIKDSIVATDLEGNVTSWNKGAENLFGYSQAFMLGRHISHVFPEEELPVLNKLVNTLKLQGTHEAEARMQRLDGSSFYARISLSILSDDHDQPVGMISYSIDITDQKANQEAIWHQAHYDKLTDLPNRWLLQDRISQNIAIAGRDNRQGAVMFLDLDRFKRINDTLGHDFGDEVLLMVSKRLSDLVREGDTLARLGGDEFVMLLSNLHNLSEAADIAERVLYEIKRPLQVAGRDVRLGGSIGIAGYPDHGSNPDTLLKHADFAMYHAKETGGDNFEFYTAEIHQQASTRFQMEHDLHNGIENNEIEVYYQPQYNIQSGKIVGLEALCRWQCDGFGQVESEDFISIAEETGLIVQLGLKVFNLVVEDILNWKQSGIEPPRIAINLSAKQIYSDENFALIKQVLTEKNLPGSAIEFEITESSLMDNPQLAEVKIKALKDLGASVAIDDFGTGYSSLSYLKRFPVDVLKIDRSFIRDLMNDADDREIIETIIGMAKNLGLSVIAEGIENKIQAEFLLKNGCHIAQGYYYSKPLPVSECTKLLMQ